MDTGRCLTLFLCFGLIWHCDADFDFDAADGQLIIGHCLENASFLTLYGLTIEGCQKECANRKKCKSFNYIKSYPLCELNAVDQGSADVQNSTGCAYMKISDNNPMRPGNCFECTDNQVCENGNNCVIRECGKSIPSENGYIHGNLHATDSKRQHVCKPGFQFAGHKTSETIICSNKTGQWEPNISECFPVEKELHTSITNGENCGNWTDRTYCPKGSLAVGYKMKTLQLSRFVTALQLTCKDQHGNITGNIISGINYSRNWAKYMSCETADGSRYYLNGFRLKKRRFQGGDCFAIEYIKFQCQDLEHTPKELLKLMIPTQEEHSGNWGSWSKSCQKKTAVCGLQTRIRKYKYYSKGLSVLTDVKQVNGLSALTDVKLFCCANFNQN